MAEAIISRRSNSSTNSEPIGNLTTEIIIENNQFVVPSHDGNLSVRVFGGGGGGYSYRTTYYDSMIDSGGGGGWMNNGEFDISTGSIVPITIGVGGRNGGYAGGTTSFGTYLSANGGEGGSMTGGGNGGAGGGFWASLIGNLTLTGSRGYQFGGGEAIITQTQYGDPGTITINGCHGGTWGGGGSIWVSLRGKTPRITIDGPKGGTYGGGGAVNVQTNGYSTVRSYSTGGEYGGEGSFSVMGTSTSRESTDGTNTINDPNVPNNCQGPGTRGRLELYG